MANDVGSNIQTYNSLNPYNYNYCQGLPKKPMNPIPWSNVTFEKSNEYNGYILRYIGDASYIYLGLHPNTLFGTMNDICDYHPLGQMGSGAINANQPGNGGEPYPPLRIIIIVRNRYTDRNTGYFYVDIDDQGNAKLST